MDIANIDLPDGIYEMGNLNKFEYLDATGRQLICYLTNTEYFRLLIQDSGKTIKLVKVTKNEQDI